MGKPDRTKSGETLKQYAKQFYTSQRWKAVRNNYWSKHPFCEDCMERGEISATEIIHHKVHITPNNINDTSITLNENNLRAVCRKCHAKHHSNKRYKVDALGRLQW